MPFAFGGTGTGGGGGFSLGPAQNTFGTTTTANRAAAVTLRNSYATANATWLALYNANRSFYIQLVWTGNASVVQRRNAAGDDWEDVTGIIRGSTGAMGNDAVAQVLAFLESASLPTAPTVTQDASNVLTFTGSWSLDYPTNPSNPIYSIAVRYTVDSTVRTIPGTDVEGPFKVSGIDGGTGPPGAAGGGAIEDTGIVLDLTGVSITSNEFMSTGLMLGNRGDTPQVCYQVEANTLSLLWFFTNDLYDIATASAGDTADFSDASRNAWTLPESAGSSVSGAVYGGITSANEFLIAFSQDDTDTHVRFWRYIPSVAQGGLSAAQRAELTRLSGVETDATADQTGTEVKTLYEAESDTNAYTDAEKTKLSGVAAFANQLIPYKIGNIYRAFASGDAVVKPGNTEGTVTESGITVAPVGWQLTRPEATAALPNVYDCHVYGYTTNGVFSWQFGTPNRTDRYIAPGGTGINEATANGLIQTALAAAVTGNTETGIAVTHNADGTFDFVVSGGGAPPLPTDDIYFGTSADEMPDPGELILAAANGVATIEAYAGNRHVLIGRLATEEDITTVRRGDDVSNTNQIGAFTKFGVTVIPMDEILPFNVWVSNQALSQDADVEWMVS